MRTLVNTTLLIAAVALAACGGDDGSGSPVVPATRAGASPAPATATDAIAPAELEREIGNSFDGGLYRLAVMRQPREDASDLGQDLPTGAVDDVACTTSSAQGRCAVVWQSVAGGRHHTRYDVKLLAHRCFAAGARPPMARVHDSTIDTFSEHPLNALVPTRKGC